MIYMALHEWERALFLLEAVLTTPAKNSLSQIQVEAYKKWVLAHLLAHGEVVSLHILTQLLTRKTTWLIRGTA